MIDDASAVNQTTYYTDSDGDGYGDPTSSVLSCIEPSNTSVNGDDCDDTDAAISPETCWPIDLDGDGFGGVNASCFTLHMEDSYGDGWNGGAVEISVDGVPVDSGLSSTAQLNKRQVDSLFRMDMRCTLPSVYRMVSCVIWEYFSDSWESENTYELMDTALNVVFSDGPTPATGVVFNRLRRLQSWLSPVFHLSTPRLLVGTAMISAQMCTPVLAEVCDWLDNDCNGWVDGSDSAVVFAIDEQYFVDSDGDGYGDPNNLVEACEQPVNAVDNDEDCDDGDSGVNPDTIWYVDADGDGFGGGFSINTCQQPIGYVQNTNDCNDIDASIYPGASEYCDGIDQDCDGDTQDADSVDALTWYTDADGDGFGDVAATVFDCLQTEWNCGRCHRL